MKAVLTGLALAVAIAALAAAGITGWEWWLNPGGVFQDETGTRWDRLWETCWSWWWPLALLCAPVTIGACAWRERRGQASDTPASSGDQQ